MFHLLDKLVLNRWGEIVYFGPKDDAVNYFAQVNTSFECPKYTHPADVFVEILAADAHRGPHREVVAHLGDIWPGSEMIKELMDSTRVETFPSHPLVSQDDKPHHKQEHAIGKVEQIQILLSRSFKNSSRNPVLTYARLFQTIVLSILWLNFFSSSDSIKRASAVETVLRFSL